MKSQQLIIQAGKTKTSAQVEVIKGNSKAFRAYLSSG